MFRSESCKFDRAVSWLLMDRIMKPVYRLIIVWVGWGLVSPLASAQNKQSQNTPLDIANSLVPGRPRVGREKTEEVDPQKLPSKSVKDTTFGGSLLDTG